MKRSKSSRAGKGMVLLLMMCLMGSVANSRIYGVKISTEKSNLLASEMIHVDIDYRATVDNDDVLMIETVYGEIFSERASEDIGEAFNTKVLYIKNPVFRDIPGSIRIQYRAPDECSVKADYVTVYSAKLIVGEDNKGTVIPKKKLASKKLKIRCADFAKIHYDSYIHSEDVDSESTEKINIDLKLILVPGKAPSLYHIKKIMVLRKSGLAMVREGAKVEKTRLIGIVPNNASPIIQLTFDEKKMIRGVRFPRIPTELKWSVSNLSFTPPKSVVIGPVAPVNRKERTEAMRRSARKLRESMRRFSGSREAKYTDFMNFLNTLNEPDFLRKGGNGMGYSWGEGRLEKKTDQMVIKKHYRWDLYLNRGE